jgi:hypothetical protein
LRAIATFEAIKGAAAFALVIGVLDLMRHDVPRKKKNSSTVDKKSENQRENLYTTPKIQYRNSDHTPGWTLKITIHCQLLGSR